MSELDSGDGIVCYSLFQMPESCKHRLRVYGQLLEKQCPIHFALEELRVDGVEARDFSEDIWVVNSAIKKTLATKTLGERLGIWENQYG